MVFQLGGTGTRRFRTWLGWQIQIVCRACLVHPVGVSLNEPLHVAQPMITGYALMVANPQSDELLPVELPAAG